MSVTNSMQSPGPCFRWYHYDHGSGRTGNLKHYNIYWRAFRFDPSAIAGKTIGSATVEMLESDGGPGSWRCG